MLIALITDTHWGVRNDSLIMHNNMKRFLDNIFFPALEERGIKDVIHLGDLVDRRKYINYITAKRLRDDFLNPLKEKNINTHVIAGNHDTFYKNTNEVNALVELIQDKYDNIKIWCKDPIEWDFGCGTSIMLMPWICDENRAQSMEAIRISKSPIVMGHFELAGFEMYRGSVNEHGDDPKVFDRFDLVCSGHYHTRSSSGNIHYLGTPCQYTWSDFGDVKGFHILDTNTRSLEFIPNPSAAFCKYHYDDLNKQMDEVLLFDANDFKDKYVKVIIKNKTNPYWFDLVIDRFEKAGAADLQVVEDHFHLDLEEDSDIINEAEDTMSIVRKYINGMKINTDQKRVENIIQELYIEAHNIE